MQFPISDSIFNSRFPLPDSRFSRVSISDSRFSLLSCFNPPTKLADSRFSHVSISYGGPLGPFAELRNHELRIADLFLRTSSHVSTYVYITSASGVRIVRLFTLRSASCVCIFALRSASRVYLLCVENNGQ